MSRRGAALLLPDRLDDYTVQPTTCTAAERDRGWAVGVIDLLLEKGGALQPVGGGHAKTAWDGGEIGTGLDGNPELEVRLRGCGHLSQRQGDRECV